MPVLALLVALVVALTGCHRKTESPIAQPVLSSTKDAKAFAHRFFAAYVAGDTSAVLDMMCASNAAETERARRFVARSQREGSPYRIESFTIRSVGAHWIQKEPYFRVEVSFPRAGSEGEILHAYTLRAKDGCVEHFLDGEAPRSSHANVPHAPGESADEVLREEETKTPSQPSRDESSAEGEEVIEL